MSAPAFENMTPLERLQASRAHIRLVLLEAQQAPDALLQKLASEHPLKLATLAALLGAALMATKPWRWKIFKGPLLSWASVALSAWLQRSTPKG